MFQRTLKKQISEPIELSLNKATPTMWDNVLIVFTDTLDKAVATYLAKAKSMTYSYKSGDY